MQLDSKNYLQKARAVCEKMPPLWPLKNFVAVNPFLGLAGRPFIEACDLIQRVAKGGMLMPLAYFQEQWNSGKIQPIDLESALEHSRKTLPAPWKREAAKLTVPSLIEHVNQPAQFVEPIPTVAETADRLETAPWLAIVVEEIARFCAAYYDEGQSIWQMPWKKKPLFRAWKSASELDAGPELLGLTGFRNLVKKMPDDAEAAIVHSLRQLDIDESEMENFLHRQLMTIRGWVGHVQYRVRENGMIGEKDDSLLHLLAIRLAYETALLNVFGGASFRESWNEDMTLPRSFQRELVAHSVWHSAFEHAAQREFVSQLHSAKGTTASKVPTRANVQAVFCIDVRSEVFRRSLEAASPTVETLGFAGFFALPLEYIRFGHQHGSAQCPVLLLPQVRVRETLQQADAGNEKVLLETRRVGKRIAHSWNSFKTSAISCFSFVESAGLGYGPKIVRDAFLQTPASGPKHAFGPKLETDANTGIDLETQVKLAYGALHNMGLKNNFARIVLLCGHGSITANNPYGSGLDCGACGGNTGEANARVGADILNNPPVRAALHEKGINIPADTWFLAGLHNTTTDDVTLYDIDDAPTSHRDDILALQNALAEASGRTRQQRAPLLGISENIDAAVRGRSADWAQVRPEWGLAGNAAFIVAPRERTRSLNFGGRSFLHNYDHQTDTDSSILELIMIAPMVVTNWINLQYYASTVNNPIFGSGNKVLHNVVGTFGVCLGNGGDLQTGLPLQSVHDGQKWIHEPHRLNVFIEAPRERISAIIAKHEGVRHLVDHAWLHLFAMENEAADIYRYLPGQEWEKVSPGTIVKCFEIPVAA